MSRGSQSPVWPFALALSVLFVLAVAAPRSWERIARDRGARLPRSAASRVVAPPDAQPPATGHARNNAATRPKSAARVPAARIEGVPTLAAPKSVESAARQLAARALATPNVPERERSAPAAWAPTWTVSQPASTADARGAVPADAVDGATSAADLALHPARPTLGEEMRAAQPDRDRVDSDEATDDVVPDGTIIDVFPLDASDTAAAVTAQVAPGNSVNPLVRPESLLLHLDGVAYRSRYCDWAREVAELVRATTAPTPPSPERVAELLVELRKLVTQADADAAQAPHDDRIELLRARHAVARRLDIWEALPVAPRRVAALASATPPREELALCLADAAALVDAGGEEGRRWREYLLLDALASQVDAPSGPQDEAQDTARRVLTRLEQAALTPAQRAFIQGTALASLTGHLRGWAVHPAPPSELLAAIERYEATGLPSDSQAAARLFRLARWSHAQNDKSLARRLEQNYRNANARLVVSEELLNRFVADPPPSNDQVRERILGVPTRGTSTTTTTVRLDFQPSPHRLLAAFVAEGDIQSTTRSDAGPATLYANGSSSFTTRKLIEIDADGLHPRPADTDARSTSRLRGVETKFDGVPLLGGMVESIVRSRHADRRDEATQEVRRKISREAGGKIDAEADKQLARVNRQLQARVLDPLEQLGLAPELIEGSTTDRRLTMRLRFADDDQLAGASPRPQAPGASLASLQLHESAVNNLLQKLDLAGNSFTPEELRQHLAERLNAPSLAAGRADHDDVTITFAKQDAVVVHCADGRVELNLALAELAAGPRSWRDFLVKVYYRPQVEGMSCRLVRDGTVQLRGDRLGTRHQLPLRGIFSRLFPENGDFVLVPAEASYDERLAGLRFIQFDVRDGWIGAAVGPAEAAEADARVALEREQLNAAIAK